ncbi:MAG: hypothetical protein NUK65_03550 [Firmicutes bacterium]|nr:hypothetical protein [Bacillota bacterium]
MDKAILKFFAVQMYEPFIEEITKIRDNEEIQRILTLLSQHSILPIILPANFEMIFHRNIVVQGKDI